MSIRNFVRILSALALVASFVLLPAAAATAGETGGSIDPNGFRSAGADTGGSIDPDGLKAADMVDTGGSIDPNG